MAMSVQSPQLEVRYAEPVWNPAWAVPEVPVPESDTHDLAIEYLRSLLLAWAERTARDVKVARNLGIRWVKEEPRCGFDPDLCVIEPPPPRDRTLSSLRLWEPAHTAPKLAIEIVSSGHPYKDYIDTPERASACGITELWVYDPMLVGPKARGGPHLLQVWSRDTRGEFSRSHAGNGPAHSPFLNAWLLPAASKLPSDAKLKLSDDRNGNAVWPTELQLVEQKTARERELLLAEIAHLKATR
jgi:Uma2 family endonuclease